MQRSILITVLNRQNASGEVPHNSICNVLKYHNVPDSFTDIIRNRYNGFSTSTVLKDYVTPFLKVKIRYFNGTVYVHCYLILVLTLSPSPSRLENSSNSAIEAAGLCSQGIGCNLQTLLLLPNLRTNLLLKSSVDGTHWQE